MKKLLILILFISSIAKAQVMPIGDTTFTYQYNKIQLRNLASLAPKLLTHDVNGTIIRDVNDYVVLQRFLDSIAALKTMGNYTPYWTKTGNNIYYNAGYVGVGTTNPQVKFHVVGDGDADGSSNNALAFINDGGVTSGNHFISKFTRMLSGVGNAGFIGGYHASGTAPDYSFMYAPGGVDFAMATYNGSSIITPLYIKNTGNVSLSALKTTGTAPTQSGTIKMVTTDNNGLLGFRPIPLGGSNTSVQYNDNGTLAGDTSLLWNKTTANLTLHKDQDQGTNIILQNYNQLGDSRTFMGFYNGTDYRDVGYIGVQGEHFDFGSGIDSSWKDAMAIRTAGGLSGGIKISAALGGLKVSTRDTFAYDLYVSPSGETYLGTTGTTNPAYESLPTDQGFYKLQVYGSAWFRDTIRTSALYVNGVNITSGGGGGSTPTVTTSSASTLTLSSDDYYVFTGTTSTWTLPASSTKPYTIKNRGSGAITLNGTLFYNSAITSLTINSGESYTLVWDGTYYNVL